jgi:hypothetical protein
LHMFENWMVGILTSQLSYFSKIHIVRFENLNPNKKLRINQETTIN